jgi:3-ketosteroid 9alpha-monooxygenase subunit A
MLRLSMKPTGWFQIGWSREVRPGQAVPMKYFGKDLVAFRSESGALSVLDAHCKHLGAHLGHGGKVRGDCVVCPYHGWAWDSEGRNANVPCQDEPTNAKLGKYDIVEAYGIIYFWHDPAGGSPRQEMALVDVFKDFEHVTGTPDDYYPCYPDAVVDKPDEPIHPQLIQENAADSMHFRYAHGAPEDPELLWFTTENGRWSSGMGFKSPKTKEVVLTLYTQNPSPGLSVAVFDGKSAHYRLVLACTPIDDATSHLRVSYFLKRDPSSPDVMPKGIRDFAASTEELFEEDARIWRHQRFMQNPVYASQDIKGYTAQRKWSERFYEAEAGPTPFAGIEE